MRGAVVSAMDGLHLVKSKLRCRRAKASGSQSYYVVRRHEVSRSVDRILVEYIVQLHTHTRNSGARASDLSHVVI
jgi:hypothetical protein